MDPALCSLETCSIEDAYITYQPTIAGNSVYIALFGILLVIQAVQTPLYRMWWFSGSMLIGLLLEVMGYAARIVFHDDPFNFDFFLMNLICLSLAPVFFCAALYFLLGRIIIVYRGEDISRLRPRNYAIFFVSCDGLALVLQSAGGAITSVADDNSTRTIGVNIMIAGLAFQVAALTLFITLTSEFAFRLRRRSRRQQSSIADGESRQDDFALIREKRGWKVFLLSLCLATLTVYTRSIFRVVELNGGFDSELANDEIAFMVLEGGMISITCLCLTVMHPGSALGQRSHKEKVVQLLETAPMSPT
ncbi:RTA1 like protein-domain-containing protein [Aspergillus cavernicola]|uniref:RTA1 like protein-domain-containing protein n=1 Tax=Aspergillus cavernicola TaxID=176166 RepID=A0ABR4I8E2_9EURO